MHELHARVHQRHNPQFSAIGAQLAGMVLLVFAMHTMCAMRLLCFVIAVSALEDDQCPIGRLNLLRSRKIGHMDPYGAYYQGEGQGTVQILVN